MEIFNDEYFEKVVLQSPRDHVLWKNLYHALLGNSSLRYNYYGDFFDQLCRDLGCSNPFSNIPAPPLHHRYIISKDWA